MKGRIIQDNGSANLYPTWNEDGSKIAFLSNKDHDYFGSTDLFIYDMKTKDLKKIAKGIYSKPAWNKNVIYYSKKAMKPNKVGSRYYDLYEYNFRTKKEFQITRDGRAFSPVFSSNDSTLFYLSTKDGTQNIFKIDLNSKSTEQMTRLNNREILGGLNYDLKNNRLIYDITTHHFKDIHYMSLADSTSGGMMENALWDERQADFISKGMVYSDDRSGIFNLYFIGKDSQGYLTNVPGGAFMADVHKSGKIAYSLFENGAYKIAILDSFS